MPYHTDEIYSLPAMMTVDELARFLRVNRNTLYDDIKRKRIPGVKRIGRQFRINRDAVIQWLQSDGRVSRS